VRGRGNDCMRVGTRNVTIGTRSEAEKGEGRLSEYNFACRDLDLSPFCTSQNTHSSHLLRFSELELSCSTTDCRRRVLSFRKPPWSLKPERRSYKVCPFYDIPFASGLITPTTMAAPSVPSFAFALAPNLNVFRHPFVPHRQSK